MDPEAFATLVELKARLEWTLSADEERIATGALESLSDDARYYGRDWLDDSEAPRQVKNLVLKAAARFMRNPDGFTTSRAADETVSWAERGEEAGEPHFTEREIKQLGYLGGQKGTIISAEISAWGPQRITRQGLVPVEGGSPFPLYNDDEEPW